MEILYLKWKVARLQVMMKSVKLEWCLGEIKNAKKLLEEAVKHYPDFAKVNWCELMYCRAIHVQL